MKKFKKRLKKIMIIAITLGVIGCAYVFGVNAYMKHTVSNHIVASKEAVALEDIDCILVLGCKVWDNGTPSAMLGDRLERGVELYRLGVAPKLLMSGDHGQVEYDEVNAMKEYAKEQGIASEDIFMDHAGFSTYESMYRAKEVFEAKKIIIVTQEYHLYRALYIAESLGLEAYGVAADYRTYVGQDMREIREILARNKDFLTSVIKPKPTHLGDVIPINGDGNATNDKPSSGMECE